MSLWTLPGERLGGVAKEWGAVCMGAHGYNHTLQPMAALLSGKCLVQALVCRTQLWDHLLCAVCPHMLQG